jgi:hypothetical protein
MILIAWGTNEIVVHVAATNPIIVKVSMCLPVVGRELNSRPNECPEFCRRMLGRSSPSQH